MRTILKGREPASLTEHRATPGADYDGYRDKDTLRAHLVAEQRGLCCYCLSRIYRVLSARLRDDSQPALLSSFSR